ncbi:MAG: hypothetical protein J6Y69_04295 [Treponema sp.]|nr:hypothetical protein [Treponema sp.]
MFTLKKSAAVLFSFFILLTSLYAEKIAKIPSAPTQFNLLGYNPNSVGSELTSPVDGKIIKEQKSGKKTTIVISCTHYYYWKGNEEKCDYEMIIYNIKNYKKASEIKEGDVLGEIADDSVLLGRCKTADPYLVLGSSYPAIKYDGLYYLQPGWIVQVTDTLSYRQVESFDDCVEDYYARWEADLEDSATNEVRYNSLFTYTEFDSICFKTKLDELPGPLNSYGTLYLTSASYFGRNIWESFTVVKSDFKYTPVMCWQTNFRSYLEDEYELGTDIYIYGTFLALDHTEKRIIFNVRDFSTRSDETRYEERLKDIKEL